MGSAAQKEDYEEEGEKERKEERSVIGRRRRGKRQAKEAESLQGQPDTSSANRKPTCINDSTSNTAVERGKERGSGGRR